MVQNIENNNKNKTRQFHIENYEDIPPLQCTICDLNIKKN